MCLGNQQTGVAGKTTDGSQTAKGAIPVINFSENEVFILKSAKFQNHSVIIAIYLNDLWGIDPLKAKAYNTGILIFIAISTFIDEIISERVVLWADAVEETERDSRRWNYRQWS